ncbi:hypothetical protein MLD38_040396 [Melastoma candidum]|uniref:Uncharacterized protein n=1 Tax=Melastoma candidum TaxID=119954 RepID=A0ACB9L5Z8_9MYRT|nr:hypothetical protein MLD38_040396 [Melastoma candidum]
MNAQSGPSDEILGGGGNTPHLDRGRRKREGFGAGRTLEERGSRPKARGKGGKERRKGKEEIRRGRMAWRSPPKDRPKGESKERNREIARRGSREASGHGAGELSMCDPGGVGIQP